MIFQILTWSNEINQMMIVIKVNLVQKIKQSNYHQSVSHQNRRRRMKTVPYKTDLSGMTQLSLRSFFPLLLKSLFIRDRSQMAKVL